MSRPAARRPDIRLPRAVYARHHPALQRSGGVQALKTGFTQEAGYNLAVSACAAASNSSWFVLRRAHARAVLPRRQRSSCITASSRRASSRSREAGAPVASPSAPVAPARPGQPDSDPRLRLRRIRHAVRRPLVVEAGRTLTADPFALSALWRQKQLEYTWLRSLMGRYERFLGGDEAALRHSLRRLSIAAGDADVARLMDAYHRLACFPEVPAALARLRGGHARSSRTARRACCGRGGLERARRRTRARHLRRSREDLQARARRSMRSPRDPRRAGCRSALRLRRTRGTSRARRRSAIASRGANRLGAPEEGLGLRADSRRRAPDRHPLDRR